LPVSFDGRAAHAKLRTNSGMLRNRLSEGFGKQSPKRVAAFPGKPDSRETIVDNPPCVSDERLASIDPRHRCPPPPPRRAAPRGTRSPRREFTWSTTLFRLPSTGAAARRFEILAERRVRQRRNIAPGSIVDRGAHISRATAGGLNIYTLMPMRRFEHQRRGCCRIPPA